MSDQTLATTLAQLGIAAIFVVAWYMERAENKRLVERTIAMLEDALERLDKAESTRDHMYDLLKRRTLQDERTPIHLPHPPEGN